MEDLALRVEQALKGKLSGAEIEALADYLQKYPYFSLGHTLRAKARPGTKEVFKAAIYTGNRWQLKKFLEGTYYATSPLDTETLAMPASTNLPTTSKDTRPRPSFFQDTFSILGGDPLVYSFEENQTFSAVATDELVPVGQVMLDLIVQHQVKKSTRMVDKMKVELDEFSRSQAIADRRARRKADASTLVERFLDAKPSMPRPDSPSPGKISLKPRSKKPSGLSEPPATETLARLLLRQNKPAEARRVFEQLRLRFPEKRAYFDAQIQKISS